MSELSELKDKVFRYGMLYGQRTILNTVIAYLEVAVGNPEIINDALINLSAVRETTEEAYKHAKEDAKSFYKDMDKEEDDEQQGQGEAL